jgi:hypothetical protein
MIKGDKHKNQKDSIRLILNDADPNLLNVFLNKRGRKPTSVVELDGICQVLVDGRGGADTLAIDFTAGVIDPPAGIVFVGGSTTKLSDKLVVQGELVGEFVRMESAYSEPGAGSISLVASDPDTNQFKSSSIEYSGLRSIDMSRAALDAAAFSFSQSDDTVTFRAGKHGLLGLAGIGVVPTSLMSPATRLEFDGRGGNDKLAFGGNPLSLGTTRLKAISEELDFETSVTVGEIRTEGKKLFVADGMKLTATTAGMDILFSDEVHTSGATLVSLAPQQSIVIHSPSASGMITSGAIETNDGTFAALGASLVAEGPITVGSAEIHLESDETVSVHSTLQAFSYSIVGAANVTIESTGGITFHVDLNAPADGVLLELIGASLTFGSGSAITIDFQGTPPSAPEQRQLASSTVAGIINQGVQYSFTGDSDSLHPTVFVSSSSISVAY